MRADALKERLRGRARELGFADIGVTRPTRSGHDAFLRSWLSSGYHGEMGYLARPDAIARRADPALSLDGVRSVVLVADHYPAGDHEGEEVAASDPSRAIVARYARGRDYHLTLPERLERLAEWLEAEIRGTGVAVESPGAVEGPGPVGGNRHRVFVDTAPVLERDLASRAGLGWFGRNTMLIHPRRGSYFLLGALFTTLELELDPPFDVDHCGSCNACVEACPTGALLGRDESGAPVMDARRCISYLTIENKGPIPEEFRAAMGNRVFGCDICQEVCPWNSRFPAELEAESPEVAGGGRYETTAWPADRPDGPPLPSLDGPDLVEFTERILAMSGKGYRRVFAESPLSRPGRKGMLRNLCVALGNYGRTSAEAAARVRPVLERAAGDRSELVREHAEWGLVQGRKR